VSGARENEGPCALLRAGTSFHLKNGVQADLPAEAEVITDPAERRRVLADIVDDFNDRNDADRPWGRGVLDEWVERSPLALVNFDEAD